MNRNLNVYLKRWGWLTNTLNYSQQKSSTKSTDMEELNISSGTTKIDDFREWPFSTPVFLTFGSITMTFALSAMLIVSCDRRFPLTDRLLLVCLGQPFHFTSGFVVMYFGVTSLSITIHKPTCRGLLLTMMTSQWGVVFSTVTHLIWQCVALSTRGVDPRSQTKGFWFKSTSGVISLLGLIYASALLCGYLTFIEIAGAEPGEFCVRVFTDPEAFPREFVGCVLLLAAVTVLLCVVVVIVKAQWRSHWPVHALQVEELVQNNQVMGIPHQEHAQPPFEGVFIIGGVHRQINFHNHNNNRNRAASREESTYLDTMHSGEAHDNTHVEQLFPAEESNTMVSEDGPYVVHPNVIANEHTADETSHSWNSDEHRRIHEIDVTTNGHPQTSRTNGNRLFRDTPMPGTSRDQFYDEEGYRHLAQSPPPAPAGPPYLVPNDLQAAYGLNHQNHRRRLDDQQPMRDGEFHQAPPVAADQPMADQENERFPLQRMLAGMLFPHRSNKNKPRFVFTKVNHNRPLINLGESSSDFFDFTAKEAQRQTTYNLLACSSGVLFAAAYFPLACFLLYTSTAENYTPFLDLSFSLYILIIIGRSLIEAHLVLCCTQLICSSQVW